MENHHVVYLYLTTSYNERFSLYKNPLPFLRQGIIFIL